LWTQLFAEGTVMQVNENVGQVQQVKRIPGVDEASVVKRAMLETRADRPGAGAPRPGARKKLEVAVGPRRRFGAGF
jgi:hypothetical protein